MKILVIAYSYPPVNAPAAHRPYFMAKYLSAMGHQVTVLTSSNSISSLGKSNWAKPLPGVAIWDTAKRTYTEQQVVDGTKDAKSGTDKLGPSGVLRKIIRFFFIPDRGIIWFRELSQFDISKIDSPDLIYSTSPLFTNHIVAQRLANKTKSKWVVDIRDFHSLNKEETQKKGFRERINAWLEKKVLTKADHVTFVTKSMHKVYTDHYDFLKHKSSVIYNGYEPQEYPAAESHLSPEVLKIFYAGSFYEGVRDPAPLFAILDALSEKNLINLDFIKIDIAGNIPDLIKERIKPYKSSTCVNYLGLIDRKAVLGKMTDSHFLWLIVANLKAHYMTFPLKGFEYIGCRRHILLFSPPEAEAKIIIDDLKAGTFFNLSLNEADIKINAEKFLQLYYRVQKGEFAAPLSLDPLKVGQYLRSGQAEQLHNIIETICKA